MEEKDLLDDTVSIPGDYGHSMPRELMLRELGFNSPYSRHSVGKAINSTTFKTKAVHTMCTKETLKKKNFKLPVTARTTFHLAFSPDGTKVASCHGDHCIYVCDIPTNKVEQTLIGHPRTPWCVTFHPTQNDILASGCLAGHVRVWDLNGGSEVLVCDTGMVIASLSFHPTVRLLAIATYNEVIFWDWALGPHPLARTSTNNPKEKILLVRFDRLGHNLITGITNFPQPPEEDGPEFSRPPPSTRSSIFRPSILTRPLFSHSNTSSRSEGINEGRGEESMSIGESNVEIIENENSVPVITESINERQERFQESYRQLVTHYEDLVQHYQDFIRTRLGNSMGERRNRELNSNNSNTEPPIDIIVSENPSVVPPDPDPENDPSDRSIPIINEEDRPGPSSQIGRISIHTPVQNSNDLRSIEALAQNIMEMQNMCSQARRDSQRSSAVESEHIVELQNIRRHLEVLQDQTRQLSLSIRQTLSSIARGSMEVFQNESGVMTSVPPVEPMYYQSSPNIVLESPESPPPPPPQRYPAETELRRMVRSYLRSDAEHGRLCPHAETSSSSSSNNSARLTCIGDRPGEESPTLTIWPTMDTGAERLLRSYSSIGGGGGENETNRQGGSSSPPPPGLGTGYRGGVGGGVMRSGSRESNGTNGGSGGGGRRGGGGGGGESGAQLFPSFGSWVAQGHHNWMNNDVAVRVYLSVREFERTQRNITTTPSNGGSENRSGEDWQRLFNSGLIFLTRNIREGQRGLEFHRNSRRFVPVPTTLLQSPSTPLRSSLEASSSSSNPNSPPRELPPTLPGSFHRSAIMRLGDETIPIYTHLATLERDYGQNSIYIFPLGLFLEGSSWTSNSIGIHWSNSSREEEEALFESRRSDSLIPLLSPSQAASLPPSSHSYRLDYSESNLRIQITPSSSLLFIQSGLLLLDAISSFSSLRRPRELSGTYYIVHLAPFLDAMQRLFINRRRRETGGLPLRLNTVLQPGPYRGLHYYMQRRNVMRTNNEETQTAGGGAPSTSGGGGNVANGTTNFGYNTYGGSGESESASLASTRRVIRLAVDTAASVVLRRHIGSESFSRSDSASNSSSRAIESRIERVLNERGNRGEGGGGGGVNMGGGGNMGGGEGESGPLVVPPPELNEGRRGSGRRLWGLRRGLWGSHSQSFHQGVSYNSDSEEEMEFEREDGPEGRRGGVLGRNFLSPILLSEYERPPSSHLIRIQMRREREMVRERQRRGGGGSYGTLHSTQVLQPRIQLRRAEVGGSGGGASRELGGNGGGGGGGEEPPQLANLARRIILDEPGAGDGGQPQRFYPPYIPEILITPRARASYYFDPTTTGFHSSRIQKWDFSSFEIPDISDREEGIIVRECSLHTDACLDISNDGEFMAVCLTSENGAYSAVGIYSLRPESLGEEIHIYHFDQNTVSVSISPSSDYIVVGYAGRGGPLYRFVHPSRNMEYYRKIGKILSLTRDGERMKLVTVKELFADSQTSIMSINCMHWVPIPGYGIIYGTNTGELVLLS